MKIAILGDIHANLPALEAILKDAHQRKIDVIWNTGDILGYGAFPDEVTKLLQDENVQSIIGNYDIKVLKIKQKKKKWQDGTPPEKWIAFNWAYENLSKKNRDYISLLPLEMRQEVEGKNILLVHGSPESNEEHITEDTPEERLSELAKIANADVIICGHSHQPFKRKVDGVWFINPGSVGRSNDGDQRASYAILQIKKPNMFQVRHYRIEYDVERSAEAIRERGLPEMFAQMIIQGQGFDRIKQEEPKNDDAYLESSFQLAKSCGYESEHTQQVINLALQIFDELQAFHELGEKERFWLYNSAILHDIGWIEGQKKHHKRALKIILEDKTLLFNERERLIIGSIARYHRAAHPKKKHAHFASLEPSERRVVKILSAILRIADGLDRSHQSIVKGISCNVTMDQILIKCSVSRPSEVDRQAALDKGQLMEEVFKRELVIEWSMS